MGAIGCTASGERAATREPTTPILKALTRPDHAGLLSEEELLTVREWLAAGAPSLLSGVHSAAFVDPRSSESHGQFLRKKRYRPMLDTLDADACGTCHEGAPARPKGIAYPAEGATACTSCHTAPSGPLDCSTCHGAPGRAYPPRDACFFPQDRANAPHAAHVETSASLAAGLSCTTCHPTPISGKPEGTHANGNVEVWFDYARAGREAAFDRTSGTCTGTCHARGGARPTPQWKTADVKTTCNDCHASPPANHYAGACTNCHTEANATGTALEKPSLHIDGKVELGDGKGTCGSCHGTGTSPWPKTGAHSAHAAPKNAKPVACETCHTVPEVGERHPVGGGAVVRLSGLATLGGRRASFDAASKSCSGTYCHEGAGGTKQAPVWTEGSSGAACGTCHKTPPPAPHAAGSDCSTSGCHVGTTDASGAFTPIGRQTHVDGLIQTGNR